MIRKGSFISLKTEGYKLHYFETASGIKFVMSTDLNVGDITDQLRALYTIVRLGAFNQFVKI